MRRRHHFLWLGHALAILGGVACDDATGDRLPVAPELNPGIYPTLIASPSPFRRRYRWPCTCGERGWTSR